MAADGFQRVQPRLKARLVGRIARDPENPAFERIMQHWDGILRGISPPSGRNPLNLPDSSSGEERRRRGQALPGRRLNAARGWPLQPQSTPKPACILPSSLSLCGALKFPSAAVSIWYQPLSAISIGGLEFVYNHGGVFGGLLPPCGVYVPFLPDSD